MEEQIQKIIEEIRPYLISDGGDIEYLGFDKQTGVVRVRLSGACQGCPISHITLYEGIQRALVENVPGVKFVEAVEE